MTKRRRIKKLSHSHIGFERLEDRFLLAGNVAASFSDGNLTLTGDFADNGITISTHETQNGTAVRVQGDPQNGNTTVNGQLGPVNFFGVINLQIALGAGDDNLTISNNVQSMLSCFQGFDPIFAVDDVALPGQIAIAMGVGNNSVDLGWVTTGSRLLIEGETNNDFVRVCGLDVGTNFLVRTFGGNDDVHVHDSNVADATTIRLANGASFVGIDGLISDNLFVYGGNHSDSMVLNGLVVFEDVVLQSYLASDTMQFGMVDNLPWESVAESSIIGNRLAARPGDGANSVDFRFVDADRVSVIGGSNYDEVFLTSISTAGSVYVDTNNGTGWVEIDDVQSNTFMNVVMGSNSDYLRVANSSVGTNSTFVLLGSHDIVEVDNVDFFNNLSVLLGDGNDDLYVSSSSAQNAYLYGNAGYDRYFAGDNFFGDEYIYSFEQF